MNQRQLASVLFAAIGVFIAASRLPDILMQGAALTPSISGIDAPASPADYRLFFILGLSSAVLAVLLGVVLVLLRNRLANRLFPHASETLSSGEVQALAISVLGCYFAVHGLSRLDWSGHRDWSGLTEFALGVGLFFGARGLSKLWSFARSAGVSRRVDDGTA